MTQRPPVMQLTWAGFDAAATCNRHFVAGFDD